MWRRSPLCHPIRYIWRRGCRFGKEAALLLHCWPAAAALSLFEALVCSSSLTKMWNNYWQCLKTEWRSRRRLSCPPESSSSLQFAKTLVHALVCRERFKSLLTVEHRTLKFRFVWIPRREFVAETERWAPGVLTDPGWNGSFVGGAQLKCDAALWVTGAKLGAKGAFKFEDNYVENERVGSLIRTDRQHKVA